MANKVIKIRHSVLGDTRRVQVAAWPDLAGLDQTLRNIYGAELPSPYSLRYTDTDGDQISITSNSELREAIETARSGILNLTVSPASSAASSISISRQTLPPMPSSALLPPSSPYYPSFPEGLPSMFPPELSVSTSQAHDTLFIDDTAPLSFTRDFATLLEMGFEWEQARDALIDFGGDLTKAAQGLRSMPRRRSQPTSRHYFSVAFARSASSLAKSGHNLKDVVAALIRNAGVASNAVRELTASKVGARCPSGHALEVSSYNLGDYATTWFCDRCKRRDKPGQRWFCMTCKYDVCFNCLPAPTPAVSPSVLVEQSPAAPPIISDMSLPPSLLEPVRMLEAMGFKDRAKILECLVRNAGDLVKCAQELADSRRAVEDSDAKAARQREKQAQLQRAREEQQARAQAERQRAREEAQRKREEAQRRAEEERRAAEVRRQEQLRLRELQGKRQDAAKIAVQTPEKIGSDLQYLMEMGFDTISSTTSLFNAGGDVNIALEELLRHRQ